jgi:prepilin-type N-terminal cleavage/methylation domain-containing protein
MPAGRTASRKASQGGAVSRKKGFTLVEMMIVVVLIGLTTLIGYPKVASGLAKANLRSSRTTLANMFAKARAVATQRNRQTSVEFNGSNVVVTALKSVPVGLNTKDTIGAVEKLDALYGVTLNASGVTSIAFDPRGFGLDGTTHTFVVTRNSKRDSIIVDRLGRVVK